MNKIVEDYFKAICKFEDEYGSRPDIIFMKHEEFIRLYKEIGLYHSPFDFFNLQFFGVKVIKVSRLDSPFMLLNSQMIKHLLNKQFRCEYVRIEVLDPCFSWSYEHTDIAKPVSIKYIEIPVHLIEEYKKAL